MKLMIKKPFEVDVEMVDMVPSYIKLKFNLVLTQSIEIDEEEMNNLISFLNFSSYQFNHSIITSIDNSTISWG